MRCLHCNYDGVDSSTVLCPRCKVHLPSLMRDLLPPGAELHGGKYRVDYALGQGGFGITYLARHASLKKPVAIKEFYPQEQVVREATTGQIVLKSSGEDAYRRAMRRFMREGETLAALDHPSVVRVNDQFEEHGTAYLVMDLVEGRTLKDELDAQPGHRLPEARVREITEQLVSALEAVHARGVYHLDIKPDNILLRPDGRAVLIDFGASKRALGTKTTQAYTLEYAAPEILAGDTDPGPESDIFELGMVVHEMLTGERPPSALSRLTRANWEAGGVGGEWKNLIASALQLPRDSRPRSVRQWWETGRWAPRQSAARSVQPTPPARAEVAAAFDGRHTAQQTPRRRGGLIVNLFMLPFTVLGFGWRLLRRILRLRVLKWALVAAFSAGVGGGTYALAYEMLRPKYYVSFPSRPSRTDKASMDAYNSDVNSYLRQQSNYESEVRQANNTSVALGCLTGATTFIGLTVILKRRARKRKGLLA